MVGSARQFVLEDILSVKQLHHVVKQSIGEDIHWQLTGCEIKAATDGIAGFLGDHMRAALQLIADGEVKTVHVFIKCLPEYNKPKAEFIDSNNYFRREKFMFQVLDEIRDENDSKPWCPKAYIYTDSIIVMPDLAVDGYASPNYLNTFDLRHMKVAVESIARFHAAFTNYETKKSIDAKRPYNTNEEYGDLLKEPTFCDSPWLRACAKLTANFLKAFSNKSYKDLPDLEMILARKYLEACDSVTERKETLNVIVHKDLWANNVMFKYDHDIPINALILDFQLIKYTLPTFDLMTFLYLTTSRSFREKHEKEICDHYYSVFCQHLDGNSKRRVEGLGYDKGNFLYWCEYARMFGILEAAAIYPFTLMHPKTAQTIFDNPDTFNAYINEDRTAPVLKYAKTCSVYRERQLEVSEEFVERYVLETP